MQSSASPCSLVGRPASQGNAKEPPYGVVHPRIQAERQRNRRPHHLQGNYPRALAGNDAPIHVGNFVELSQKGYYDGLKFHRYVPGFVIQGGCPNTRDLTPEQVINEGSRRGCGMGNPGYSIHEEYTTNPNNVHKDGTLAMARSSNPNSAGSQFILLLGRAALPR